MREANSAILRISGAIFLLTTMLSVIEMIGVNVGAFMFLMHEDSAAWGFYFVLLGIIFTFHVVTSLLSCSTALLFGGKDGYYQTEWNFAVYSLVSISLYVGVYYIGMLIDGISTIPEDLQFTYLVWIVSRAAFLIIVFVCCEKEKGFSWKNILPVDDHSKLCAKMTLGFCIVLLAGCFIYGNYQLSNMGKEDFKTETSIESNDTGMEGESSEAQINQEN